MEEESEITLKTLESKVLEDEKKLKSQFLKLTKERNMFYEKLKFIQAYGNEKEWEGNLLAELKNIIYNEEISPEDLSFN